MDHKTEEFSFTEWQELSYFDKREIWSHYWNPYKPEIGLKTKKEIVDNFIKSTGIKALQFGLKSFGWGVYLIFVVVEDSKIRVPKQFVDITVNKGIVKNKFDNNFAEVKFNYGGTSKVDLRQRIVIG